MRVKLEVSKLAVGDLAFLPYWGKLLKAKIEEISSEFSYPNGKYVRVRYVVLSEPSPRHSNYCVMNVNSVYEVYTR